MTKPTQGVRTVWLIGPDTAGTLPALGRAFERLGWAVTLRPYWFIHSSAQRWFWKLAGHLGQRPRLEARWYNQFLREKVLPEILSEPPRLLVFLLTYNLEPDTYRALAASRIPLITWATDSLSRYGRFSKPWNIAARNYVFDGGDAEPGKTTWLPLGFDDEVFRPGETREWDVLFVGRIFAVNYSRRLQFLELLAESELLSTHRVALVGSVVRQYRRFERRFSECGGVLLGDRPVPDLARLIASAKLAVTIHQDDGCQPVNPMFFAIPGCRTCLVTDRRDYLGRWLRADEEFVPVGPGDFLHCLQTLLRDETSRTELADRGYRAALKHTWVERVRTVLEEFQLPLA